MSVVTEFDADLLHDLMDAIPRGRWTTYGELAAEAGTIGRALGSHIRACVKCPNTWRVLDEQGKPSPRFAWSDPHDNRDVREVLRGEGIYQSDGRADATSHISVAELRVIAERDVFDQPTVEWVKDPVERVTGQPNRRPISMRHFADCDHWYRIEGTRQLLGPAPRLATDKQMRALPPCKDCIQRAQKANHPVRGARLSPRPIKRRYWWVSQGYNYETAIGQATLWSLPKKGRDLPDRRLLKSMRPGDLVMHYADKYLRAVSVVEQPWRPAKRPKGYRMRPGDGDDGWLVGLKVKETGLKLHFSAIADLIPHGPPGPLTQSGVPMQIYVASLDETSATAVLSAAGASIPAYVGEENTDSVPFALDLDETDRSAVTRVRREQSYLRRHLLSGRAVAPCGLCGKSLPSRLLVAAHIIPRRLLDEAERLDFTSAAFLACSLGCDTLFEWGYVAVDSSGHVVANRRAESAAVERAVEAIAGGEVVGFSAANAPKFAQHIDLHTST